MKLAKIIYTISTKLKEHNAKAIVVGGSVRDHFLKLPIKDYDIEVYGLENIEDLENILVQYGSVNLVGKSFGVLKFQYDGQEYDFSFPRSEQKTGIGHRGFDVSVDGAMSFKEASKRRDFTINAMGYDVEEELFLDPYNGQKDIENRLLRHIDDETFIEDPLRVYRAVQFSARFNYTLSEETFELCRSMVANGMLEELAKERIYVEFKKLLLKSPKPSIGFELMRELDILFYFPELKAIIDVPQPIKWHPEGDVWIHTMMCIDEMVKLFGENEKLNLKYILAVLCHDLGKATHTTIEEDGRIRAIGHEKAGVKPTKDFLYRLTNEHDFIASILPLVEYHLKPTHFYAGNSGDKAIRRLATKVNIEELVVVAKADFLGRTTKESLAGIYHAGEWMLERAKNLKVSNRPLKKLLQGRDLIALGLEPSSKFKEILEVIYNLQLDGFLSKKEEALEYIKINYLEY
ncbi:tRNA nucleotidyltransferase [hydrothermal vent metagenome]|uniref:tRNA nucleotidyltransferase n=1 Tax=hydrothermal vent metagenome TaxID=652676 RepID=A0A1W1BKC1_9ZZZZ